MNGKKRPSWPAEKSVSVYYQLQTKLGTTQRRNFKTFSLLKLCWKTWVHWLDSLCKKDHDISLFCTDMET